MTSHTVLIPLALERPLSNDEFDELISWAERTGAYRGGLVMVDDDYAGPMLRQLDEDLSLMRKENV